MNAEINITYRCNAKCIDCNRMLDRVDIPYGDLTPEQAIHWGETCKRPGLRFSKVKLGGGEPLTHPRFSEIIEALRGFVGDVAGKIWVLTNNTWDHKPELPEGFRYHRSGISGKHHDPIWISPHDLGIKPRKRGPCSAQKMCGYGYDYRGFCPCPLAHTYALLFDAWDVYSREPVLCRDRRICTHCIYSVPARVRNALFRQVEAGGVRYPTLSIDRALRELGERNEAAAAMVRNPVP